MINRDELQRHLKTVSLIAIALTTPRSSNAPADWFACCNDLE